RLLAACGRHQADVPNQSREVFTDGDQSIAIRRERNGAGPIKVAEKLPTDLTRRNFIKQGDASLKSVGGREDVTFGIAGDIKRPSRARMIKDSYEPAGAKVPKPEPLRGRSIVFRRNRMPADDRRLLSVVDKSDAQHVLMD